jgi:hypothetical protein
MGQSVVALMYGVKRSELPDGLREECDDWPWYGELADGPDDAYEGDCIGFPVAVSSCYSDEDNLGETCFLSEIETVHAAGIAAAKEKWAAFAAWFSACNLGKLPKAGLILTRDERA